MSNIITKAEREMRKQIPADQVLPSRWQMVKNLVQAAADAVKGGFDVRGPEETEVALNICAACPHLVEQDGGARCGQCGCWLGGVDEIDTGKTDEEGKAIKTYKQRFGKSSLKAWHCPLGKW
jgi:hypothetical protein